MGIVVIFFKQDSKFLLTLPAGLARAKSCEMFDSVNSSVNKK